MNGMQVALKRPLPLSYKGDHCSKIRAGVRLADEHRAQVIWKESLLLNKIFFRDLRVSAVLWGVGFGCGSVAPSSAVLLHVRLGLRAFLYAFFAFYRGYSVGLHIAHSAAPPLTPQPFDQPVSGFTQRLVLPVRNGLATVPASTPCTAFASKICPSRGFASGRARPRHTPGILWLPPVKANFGSGNEL